LRQEREMRHWLLLLDCSDVKRGMKLVFDVAQSVVRCLYIHIDRFFDTSQMIFYLNYILSCTRYIQHTSWTVLMTAEETPFLGSMNTALCDFWCAVPEKNTCLFTFRQCVWYWLIMDLVELIYSKLLKWLSECHVGPVCVSGAISAAERRDTARQHRDAGLDVEILRQTAQLHGRC